MKKDDRSTIPTPMPEFNNNAVATTNAIEKAYNILLPKKVLLPSKGGIGSKL